MSMIFIIIIYIVLFYYLFVGRRKKEKKKMEDMMSQLSYGTKIFTVSGMCVKVLEVRDTDLIVELCCDGEKSIKAKLHKGAVRGLA